MPKAMCKAINRVGIDVIGEEFHRIGMHIKRIFLRIVLSQELTCGPPHARLFVILETLAKQAIIILLVHIYHVAVAFALASLVVVIKAVARNSLVFVVNS